MELYYYGLKDIVKMDYCTWSDVYDVVVNNLPFKTNYSNLTSNEPLLNDLVNRWMNPHIYLFTSDKELTFDSMTQVALDNLRGIFNKLNLILPRYKTLKERFEKIITDMNDEKLTVKSTNTSINRHNDTPNQDNDYSANKYTSDINQTINTSESGFNSLDNYDIIKQRLDNLPQMIINEMKEFEIWM